METLIPNEPIAYFLEGEKIFHDEERVWREVLERHTELRPLASGHAAVRPPLDQPKFSLDDTILKPRFASMNKVTLASWLRDRGFAVPPDLKKVTKAQLVNRAERVWDDSL